MKCISPQLEAAARALCTACDENPDHKGDAQGNDFRWQDYVPLVEITLAAYNKMATTDGTP